MKKLFIILILIISCYSIYAEELSDEQLMQIVKNFENNQTLTGFETDYSEYLNAYEVKLKNNVEDKWWEINKNGQITNYFNNVVLYDKGEIIYSDEQCKNIALTFLNNKNISLLNYNLIPIETNFCECKKFYFVKLINQNIQLLSKNLISVGVNPHTGLVGEFLISYDPDIELSVIPELSDTDVQTIVTNIFGENYVNNIEITIYSYNEEMQTIIRIAKVNNDAMVYIDAYSHNVLAIAGLGNFSNLPEYVFKNQQDYNNSLPKKNINFQINKVPCKIITDDELIKFVPKENEINFILCDTENPKDVKYTVIPTGFEIDKEDKGIARMEANGKKFIFRNGSYWCFINNKTYNMGGNCIIKDGILQLPEDFYKKVQTKDYDFFPKSQNSITK